MDCISANFCQTCLSYDRFLRPMGNVSKDLENLGINIKNDNRSGICWECNAIVMKLIKFKTQVIRAQNAFAKIIKHEHLTSMSKLTCHNKYVYDLEIQYSDPLTNIHSMENEATVKLETVPDVFADELPIDSGVQIEDIKKENDYNEEKINKIDIFNDQRRMKADNMRKPKILKRNKHSARKKSLLLNKADILDYEDVKDKFTTVTLTEEEMLRSREEKRNQPNFKKIPYKCDSCVLGFTRRETYEVHIKKKHDKSSGKYRCDVCQSHFPSTKLLDRHIRRHYIVHRCLLCEYESLELWSAIGHCRSKHGIDIRGSIHCQQCTAVFRSPQALAEHIKTQHILRCNECGDQFKGKHTLRTHKIRIHGARRDFVCDTCGKTFKTKSRLETHVAGHNAALAMKLAFCSLCNVQYKNIYVYRNHLKNSVNHSERVFECKECNKKFASKVYWRKHNEFYHLHKSKYKCEICNKLFISDWRLKNHSQTHHAMSRTRNHACNVCGKKFFTPSTLRGHQLTHSEQRSYMCEDCGDTFKQRPALYTHMRLVHGGGKRK